MTNHNELGSLCLCQKGENGCSSDDVRWAGVNELLG